MSGPETDPGLLEVRRALLRPLFSASVEIGLADPLGALPAPFPAEAACLSPQAVDKRRREFAAGRAAAHQAMRASGQVPAPVLIGPKRAPLWPTGLVGSISHTRSIACAALARCATHLGLGLDVEEDTPLERSLWSAIATPAERDWLEAAPNPGQLGKLLFSAKEAAYKAQYCQSGRYFGFDGMDLRFDMALARFTARFTEDQPPFHRGEPLKGRFAIGAGVIITAVEIPNHEPCA